MINEACQSNEYLGVLFVYDKQFASAQDIFYKTEWIGNVEWTRAPGGFCLAQASQLICPSWVKVIEQKGGDGEVVE